jgi:hypothetical protein
MRSMHKQIPFRSKNAKALKRANIITTIRKNNINKYKYTNAHTLRRS